MFESKGGAKQFGHSSYIENLEAEGDGEIEFIYSPSNGNSNGPPYKAYGQGPSSIAFDSGCGEFLHIEVDENRLGLGIGLIVMRVSILAVSTHVPS
jgi:hypothetical protein